MNTIINSEEPSAVEQSEKELSRAALEFNAEIDAIISKHTPADLAAVNDLIQNKALRLVQITPIVAALIWRHHNLKNREINYTKVRDFVAAMQRGEWITHHQGVAFYENNTLADGQHRLAATAIAGTTNEFIVFHNFAENAIDAIDRSKRRTAGEGLEMKGINDARLKAAVAKEILAYERDLTGGKLQATDYQIEDFVIKNKDLMIQSIKIGRDSIANVSETCLSIVDVSISAGLMLHGGWNGIKIQAYVAAIQQGIASYPESPTVYLARVFMKAKVSERRKDRLTKRERLALLIKGANLWTTNTSVLHVKWNQSKETLPLTTPPDEEPTVIVATPVAAAAA